MLIEFIKNALNELSIFASFNTHIGEVQDSIDSTVLHITIVH